MFRKNKVLTALALSVIALSFTSAATAKPNEYDLVIKHLREKYKAKKVGIPFMTLARVIVAVARPAGVKAFKITVFEGLQFSKETLDKEMQEALRGTFGPEWIPILRVRSRDGEQVYMYMRESGQDVKINLVTIDKENAAVIRATFNPDKLIDFMNNPKIFGISLDDKPKENQTPPSPETSVPPEKQPGNE
ncbi:MAG: hypothetical protein ACRD43_11130 [Pyrinomonadaceae bacterium]